MEKRIHGVGFEPTSANTTELESVPLDQLGHPCEPLTGIEPATNGLKAQRSAD